MLGPSRHVDAAQQRQFFTNKGNLRSVKARLANVPFGIFRRSLKILAARKAAGILVNVFAEYRWCRGAVTVLVGRDQQGRRLEHLLLLVA